MTVSSAGSLQGRELVAHVFVAAGAADGYDRLLRVWTACCDAFDVGGPGADEPPASAQEIVRGAGGVFALRRGSGNGKHQLVLRHLRDTYCLALLSAPDPGDPAGWADLRQRWERVVPEVRGRAVVGSALILQARLGGRGAALETGTLDHVVRDELDDSGARPRGHVRVDGRVGALAHWEAPAGTGLDDTRAHRRFVVIAPAARDPELSAWTWTRGDRELTPFGHYLLNAAMLRAELRGWARERDETAPGATDATIEPLMTLLDDVAATGTQPGTDELLDASTRVVRLQAGEAGLVSRAGRLRDRHRTASLLARNMTARADGDQESGLFADDRALAEWFVRQLEHDLAFTESGVERVRGVVSWADQVIQRGLQRRQERFNLGLTGVVGAVLVLLAAIQSFQYDVPLPGPVRPAVIALLGAFALLTSMIVLRVAVAGRRLRAAAGVWVAAALLGGACGWIVAAAAGVAPSTTWWIAAVGGLVGAAVAVRVVRPGPGAGGAQAS